MKKCSRTLSRGMLDLHSDTELQSETEAELRAFTEADAAQPREGEVRKRKREECSAESDDKVPAGPLTYEDIMSMMPSSLAEDLHRHKQELHANFLSRCVGKTVLCSTSYSGMGCFEACLASMNQELNCKFVSYSACDIDEPQRQALLAAEPGPQHVFGDICQRVLEPWRSSLHRTLERYVEQCQSLAQPEDADCQDSSGKAMCVAMMHDLSDALLS